MKADQAIDGRARQGRDIALARLQLNKSERGRAAKYQLMEFISGPGASLDANNQKAVIVILLAFFAGRRFDL